MKLFDDLRLAGALKEYDLTDSVASTPVSFSEEFELRMEKLIRQKQRSYNVRVRLQHAVPVFIVIALVGSLFFLLLHQRDTDNETVPLQDTTQVTEQDSTRVSALPAARGNIYDRNGVLLVSSWLSNNGNSYIREYHTVYAAHLLGYEGAELAFEEFLRGVEGEQISIVSEDGTVSNVEVTNEPVLGQHVYLTIEIDLQEAAEHALRTQIEKINVERALERQQRIDDGKEDVDNTIPGGAVVVTNVNTGEILAAASYPTFNLARLDEDWALLTSDPANPMLNRATQGIYSPGSTFQMVTAIAGLRNIPRIARYFQIDDTGVFERYGDAGFVMNCWIYNYARVGHAQVDVVQALEVSCDFFFVQIADWLGPARDGAHMLADAATELGLGAATGLEIPESEGRLALPEVREATTGENTWYVADTLLAGIGQGENRFTPVQLANYAATIANGGTLYSLSLLRSVRSSDFSEELFIHEPKVLNVIEETDIIEIIQEGMVAVSRGRYGLARNVLRNAFGDYPVTVAAKTGTVQLEGRELNDGVFVAYAPAENPEIAISVVVEKGGSNAAIIEISRIIFDHYFNNTNT